MIVTVRDPNILSNLDPQQLNTYLLSNGWFRETQIGDSEAVWVISMIRGEFDITLPLNPKSRSYALRMAEILEILEKVEGRSQLDILSDLVTVVPHAEIEGMVIQLDERKYQGDVTIMGFIVSKPRQIQMMLGENEYYFARTAYIERLPIVCTGDLVKENGAFVLKKISRFAYCDECDRAAV